jgi:ATP-dependent Clp protease ATP-binding subunit ClpA
VTYHLNTSDSSKNATINNFTPNNQIASKMKALVVGQDHAIDIIVPCIKQYNAGLIDDGKPIGAFLLLGPTGVGKTETCRALAKVLHGCHSNFIRIDCGEYQTEHEVAKLIGSPPGYLGHRETKPVLTQAALDSVITPGSSISIVLLDEIEKAARSLQRIFLGILDYGTLTLGDSSKVFFKNTIFILTSNLGAREIESILCSPVGFPGAPVDRQDKKLKTKLKNTATLLSKKHFSSEFVNRLSATIVYNNLTDDNYKVIINNAINAYENTVYKVKKVAISIRLTIDASARILELGRSDAFGAREMNRTVKRIVTSPITELLTSNYLSTDCTIKFDYKNGEFLFDVTN